MKRTFVVVGVLLAAVVGSSSSRVSAASGPPSLINGDPAATEAFWTPTAMAGARALPLPKAGISIPSTAELESPPAVQVSARGAKPTLSGGSSIHLFTPQSQEETVTPEAFGSAGLRFTSSRLMTDAVANLGGERTYPYALTGQLTFTIPPGTSQPPGNYVCSATVQRIGVITTAGHCVSDGHAHFYTNWKFTPAIRSGNAPYGTWIWRHVVTTNTWFTGGGGVPNAQDVAVIALFPNSSGTKIGSFTGYAGFNIPDLYAGQHVTTIGYPCNLDSCAIDHRNDAQVVVGSNNTDIVGTDMGGGASGGGWLINYGQYSPQEPVAGANDANLISLVADTSYGPVAGGVLYLGASILDGRYVQCTPLNTCAASPTAILNYVCVNNPGYC